MPKTWIFSSSGEVRPPKKGEWCVWHGFPSKALDDSYLDLTILTVTVLDHDPLEPIREVYEKWKDIYTDSEVPDCDRDMLIEEMWKGIEKAMEAK